MSPDASTSDSRRGRLLILSGPSGVGKTTLAHALVDRLGAVFSVSMTTRPVTPKDVPGRDYFFVTAEEFQRARDAGDLLEWANVFDNLYGTPRAEVERELHAGRDVLLEIDVHGCIQVKRNMPEAVAMFVLPPSEDVLLQRLRSRRREDETTIQKRFQKARDEIATARSCGCYSRFIVNDDFDRAVEEAVGAVGAVRGVGVVGARGREEA